MIPTIRTALLRDIAPVAAAMRVRDQDEVRAASGWSPEAALHRAVDASALRWTICDPAGEPFAMFGAAPFPGLDPHYGCPWMLATDAFAEHAMFVLRRTRPYVAIMHRMFPVLVNYVDCRNADSMRYLRWSGFRFTAFDPEFGVERRPFLQFMSIRNV